MPNKCCFENNLSFLLSYKYLLFLLIFIALAFKLNFTHGILRRITIDQVFGHIVHISLLVS